MKSVRICILILVLFVWILPVGCGGGGGDSGSITTSSQTNVQPITVDGGPLSDYPNAAFTSVMVCEHGSTSNCTTIDHVLVDTGSSGLRLLSSALTLTLPEQTTGGNPIGECFQFTDGSYVWGPVKTADVYLANGNEIASSVPIHVLDSTFYTPPSDCSSSDSYTEEDDLDSLGANGILGIGSSRYDCSYGGTNYCDPSSGLQSPPTGTYYTCTSSVCTSAFVSLSQQVQNPVALFSTDNNGVIIELPAVTGPTATLTGSMIFGIGTQSNNGLGSATMFTLDQDGLISTKFNNTSLNSFIDSGSNGYFFPDTIPRDSYGWYIPGSTLNLIATMGNSTNVSFSVGNADDLFKEYPTYAVFNTLAGYTSGYFDWGLPFFYGRNVYTSITPNGDGTYWAF